MDLQSVFYVMSITFITFWLVFLLVLIAGSLLMFRKFNRIQDKVSEKLDTGVAKVLLPLLPILPAVMGMVKKLKQDKRSS